jgi:hypothetical protein
METKKEMDMIAQVVRCMQHEIKWLYAVMGSLKLLRSEYDGLRIMRPDVLGSPLAVTAELTLTQTRRYRVNLMLNYHINVAFFQSKSQWEMRSNCCDLTVTKCVERLRCDSGIVSFPQFHNKSILIVSIS